MRLSTCLALTVALSVPSDVVADAKNLKQFEAASSIATIPNVRSIDAKQRPSFVIESAISQRGGNSNQKDSITGAIVLTLIERSASRALKSLGYSFPSQLGGCMALLVFMFLAEAISPGLGDSIFTSLSPGSALLAKWLPVFFVPGLAMLPLAPSVGSGFEVAKVLSVVILGFVYSLVTVAFPVMFLRGTQKTAIPVKSATPPRRAKAPAPSVPPKAFADETMSGLIKGTVATGALSLAATKMNNEFATPMQSIFLCVATFTSYVWGARLPASFNKVFHPLITSTVLTLATISLTGKATGADFLAVLKTYKTGTLDLTKTGAGDVLLFLLGPSVVSFAVAIYGRRNLLKENLFIVLAAMLISSAGGLFGTAAFVRAIQLGGSNGAMIRLSVLSRNVTTALSMAIANILGGDLSIAASAVVLTGIIGATYARRMLDALGISDPITRGLAVGASSQGLGVASLVGEPDAFPFAAMSMVLTAVCATILVSIPAVKDLLINMSVGA